MDQRRKNLEDLQDDVRLAILMDDYAARMGSRVREEAEAAFASGEVTLPPEADAACAARIREAAAPVRRARPVRTATRRILLAAALALLLAVSVFAAVPSVREGLLHFFLHDNGAAYTLSFSPEELARAPKEIDCCLAPTWLPDGFRPEKTLRRDDYFLRVYTNDAGDCLHYHQMVLSQVGSGFDPVDGFPIGFAVSSENATVTTEILEGYEVRLIRTHLPDRQDDLVFLWTDHQYLYSVGAPHLEPEEIEAIIAGMAPIDK